MWLKELSLQRSCSRGSGLFTGRLWGKAFPLKHLDINTRHLQQSGAAGSEAVASYVQAC